jgi:hypothetical protein
MVSRKASRIRPCAGIDRPAPWGPAKGGLTSDSLKPGERSSQVLVVRQVDCGRLTDWKTLGRQRVQPDDHKTAAGRHEPLKNNLDKTALRAVVSIDRVPSTAAREVTLSPDAAPSPAFQTDHDASVIQAQTSKPECAPVGASREFDQSETQSPDPLRAAFCLDAIARDGNGAAAANCVSNHTDQAPAIVSTSRQLSMRVDNQPRQFQLSRRRNNQPEEISVRTENHHQPQEITVDEAAKKSRAERITATILANRQRRRYCDAFVDLFP